MLRRLSITIIALFAAILPFSARAQYYQMAQQLPQLISPALSGSLNYKGFVDLTGTAGFGHNRANDLSITTSQGFQYASWFFMGVGAGVDVMIGQDVIDHPVIDGAMDYFGHPASKTKVMIPLFTDFRFTIGPRTAASLFADIKIGASWLLGNSYLKMTDGVLTGATQFFLRPSVGVRVPINKANASQAVNIGLTYQLLTSNSNYYWASRSLSLNNVGLSIAYEW